MAGHAKERTDKDLVVELVRARNCVGPCRMITPRLYAWKGTERNRRIELLAEKQSGSSDHIPPGH